MKSSRDSGGEKTVAPGEVTSLVSALASRSWCIRGVAEETRRVGGYSFEQSSGAFKPTQGDKGELSPGFFT